MPVVVDNNPLSVDSLGLRTFGQVLSHLQRENRLVVHVLIDGEVPDLEKMPTLRQTPTDQHTIYVETTEPAAMANDVLDVALVQLREAEQLCADAVGFLQADNQAKAFENLSGCFSRWQRTQQSVLQVSQLLRLDLNLVHFSDNGREPLQVFLAEFGERLRAVKEALESRDFVALADVLQYEIPECTSRWPAALEEIRKVAAPQPERG